MLREKLIVLNNYVRKEEISVSGLKERASL